LVDKFEKTSKTEDDELVVDEKEKEEEEDDDKDENEMVEAIDQELINDKWQCLISPISKY